jgi:hypothetical protein
MVDAPELVRLALKGECIILDSSTRDFSRIAGCGRVRVRPETGGDGRLCFGCMIPVTQGPCAVTTERVELWLDPTLN